MSGKNVNMEAILAGRPPVEGVTIDEDHTRNYDDAFYIKQNADGTTTIEVSISDAPALVQANSQMDLDAQQFMRDVFHQGRKMVSMLPLSLVHEFLSLSKGKVHPAVTFTIQLDKDMAVTDMKVARTAFTNISRRTLREVDGEIAGTIEPRDRSIDMQSWLDVAKALYARRQNEMIQAVAYNIPDKLKGTVTADPMAQPSADGAGKFMVREIMALVNGEATRYMRENQLPMAKQEYETHIYERFKRASTAFDGRAQLTARSIERKLTDLSGTVKVTSPNRSYVDLINLRTIVAHLEGQSAPHTAAEMKAAVSKDSNLSSLYTAAGEFYQSADDFRAALVDLAAGNIKAIAEFQMETVSRFHKQAEKAYYAKMGQGDPEVRNHAPRCEHYDALMRIVGGGKHPQFTVSKVCVAGVQMFFSQLQVEQNGPGRVVNVTGAGVSPGQAMDQAAAAALMHMGKLKPPR